MQPSSVISLPCCAVPTPTSICLLPWFVQHMTMTTWAPRAAALWRSEGLEAAVEGRKPAGSQPGTALPIFLYLYLTCPAGACRAAAMLSGSCLHPNLLRTSLSMAPSAPAVVSFVPLLVLFELLAMLQSSCCNH